MLIRYCKMLSVLLITFVAAVAYAAPTGQTATNDVLRLHIIANSDSHVDQSAKLAVRDAVILLERELFNQSDASNSQEARDILMENAKLLLSTVDSALAQYGADYSAQLKIGVYNFPDREYNGVFYPANSYQALRIVLGNGNGQNWWCVMFPPLCILESTDSDSNSTENSFDENTDSVLGFKSLFVELFDWFTGLFA